MILKACCCLLSLQTGVVILASSYIFVAIAILVRNVGGKLESPPPGFAFVVLFLSLMLVTGVFMFCAALHQKKSLCSTSVCLILVMIALFLVGSGISFSNATWTRYVCVDQQCPETLWFAPLKNWTCLGGAEPPYQEETPMTFDLQQKYWIHPKQKYWIHPNKTRTIPPAYSISVSDEDYSDDTSVTQSTFNTSPPSRFFKEICNNTKVEVSVVLMLINLIFMLYSVLIMFSFSQELTVRKLHNV